MASLKNSASLKLDWPKTSQWQVQCCSSLPGDVPLFAPPTPLIGKRRGGRAEEEMGRGECLARATPLLYTSFCPPLPLTIQDEWKQVDREVGGLPICYLRLVSCMGRPYLVDPIENISEWPWLVKTWMGMSIEVLLKLHTEWKPSEVMWMYMTFKGDIT